ncbi:hypothetical protein JZ751_000942 [Albula glossodonta]|uniref:Uncharacterized protein n=1 Tax=Albula glossodonta TaxID=121402 RepID=A0A8T2PXU6_9TELE|nr:hypothetical protein JZ751_000942 [Albula glossodonta]
MHGEAQIFGRCNRCSCSWFPAGVVVFRTNFRIQHITEILAGLHGGLNEPVEVVLVQAGVHLQEGDLTTPGEQGERQGGAPTALLGMAQICQGRVLHKARRTRTDIVPHRDARIYHGQGGSVHACTVVPAI